MSLRLVFTIGIALAVLWSVAARMVSGLLVQTQIGVGGRMAITVRDAVTVPGSRGIACQIRSLRGGVIATTQGASSAIMDAKAPGYRIMALDGAQWRTYTLQANGFSITTADSLNERAGLRRRIALAAGLPFLIAAIGGLLALWLGAGRGLVPLEKLRSTMAQRQPDAMEPLAAHAMPDELRPLVESLNHLLQRVAQAVLRERNFTNHAAHELRTPLTAIDTRLQLARLTTGDDAQRALDDVGKGVRRMPATLDQLLMLARIEGRLPFDEGELISASEVVERVIASIVPDAGTRIVRHGSEGNAVLAVPPALAVVALRNLVDNALRYSPVGSPVEVVTDSICADGAIRFRVFDRGSGLPPEGHADATQRFWRGAGANGGGSGLAWPGDRGCHCNPLRRTGGARLGRGYLGRAGASPTAGNRSEAPSA